MPQRCVVGVDLGGTKIHSVLADHRGQVRAEIVVPTKAEEGLDAVLNTLVDSVASLVKAAGLLLHQKDIRGIGVGAPGPLDTRSGVVHVAPNLGWRNIPLKSRLETRLNLPVLLDNDANLAALGEQRFGAGERVSPLIYLTLGTGIGGGIIIDHQLYRGASDGAGEVGHMTIEPNGPQCGCGNYGCLEAVASGTAMARHARELIDQGRGGGILVLAGGDPGKITGRLVAQAANGGDEDAREIIAQAGRYLGIGVASLINLFNPAVIVLGGGAAHNSLLLAAMKQQAERRAFQSLWQAVKIVPAQLGERAGALGAVALVLDQ